MADRYADDLRRIIGINESRKGLGEAAHRDPIYKNLGIGYLDASGTVTGATSSGEVPEDAAQKDENGEIINPDYQGGDADLFSGEQGIIGSNVDDQGRTFDPGSGGSGGGGGGNGGGGNINNAITGKETGQYTANEILIDNVGPTSGEYRYDSSGNLITGGVLKELVATDCDSGKEMRIRTDGLYTPPEATYASETIQNDTTVLTYEYDDPDTPPTEAPADGFVYVVEFFSIIAAPNPVPMYYSFAEAFAYAEAFLLGQAPLGDIVDAPGADYETYMYDKWIADYPQPRARIQGQTCTTWGIGSGPWINGFCPFTPPDPEDALWPNQGFFDTNTRSPKLTLDASDSFIISMSAGLFEPHPDDQNVPTNISQGVTRADFCFGTSQYGTIEPSRDGGFLLYETISKGGDVVADGVIRTLDKNGALTGYTDNAVLPLLKPNT